jgi:hypothetical protein
MIVLLFNYFVEQVASRLLANWANFLREGKKEE